MIKSAIYWLSVYHLGIWVGVGLTMFWGWETWAMSIASPAVVALATLLARYSPTRRHQHRPNNNH
jgi:hypothetical protein